MEQFKDYNEEIKELAKILNEADLGEISVKIGEASISIKAKEAQMVYTTPQAAAVENAPKKEIAEKHSGSEVKSPIVGTFYASPAPDKPPFVTVGSAVKKGDPLFIIESMKLMNEVQSDFDGVVSEILVSDGQGLEFGQLVMTIK